MFVLSSGLDLAIAMGGFSLVIVASWFYAGASNWEPVRVRQKRN
jgi:hypothetical protein